MNREIHVRFWESAGVRFPCATQHAVGLEGELARSASRQFEATRSEPRLLVFRPSAWARSTAIQGRRAAPSMTDFAPLV